MQSKGQYSTNAEKEFIFISGKNFILRVMRLKTVLVKVEEIQYDRKYENIHTMA